MEKSYLVAVDGSQCSNIALSYIANLFLHNDEVVLHLLNCTSPSGITQLGAEDSSNTLLPIDEHLAKNTTMGNRHLQKALDKLQTIDFPKHRVTYSAKPASNIALTIEAEAQKKIVDAIIVARRGLGFVGEMLFGSVSAALFQKCRSTPLWLLDGNIKHPDIMISLDGSPASLLAVDQVGHMFSKRSDLKFYLYHCRQYFAPRVQCELEPFYKTWDKEWVDKYLAGQDCLFHGPARVLHEAGIPLENITILPEDTNLEESGSIIATARKHNCGTIVMGRRRTGMARGIFGDLARRTILQTQNMALLLVG